MSDETFREELRVYLDYAITNWRERRDAAKSETDRFAAMCYVDAFQSVRVSMLGELLD